MTVLLSSTLARADDVRRYDVASYKLSAAWKHEDAGAAMQHTVIDGNNFCQINVFKSKPGSGDIKAEFASFWNTTAAEWKFTGAAAAIQRPAIPGWTSKAGRGSFVAEGITIQSTVNVYANATSTFSVISIGNSARCETSVNAFFATLSLAAPSTTAPTASPAPSATSGEWTSTIQPDWVLVTKGSLRVYLYFVVPYNASDFSGTGVVPRDHYWTNFVGRQFAIASTQYRDGGEYIGSFKPQYVEGVATDRATNERRFIAMTLGIVTNGVFITVASAPDEATLRAAFPNAADKNASDLAAMSRFNRFPLGSAKDIAGTWLDGASNAMQWYDRTTGNYVGSTFAASSSTFTFKADGTYTSIHNGASGSVGAMKTFQQNYKGTFKVEPWAVTATKRFNGKTATFAAYLEAVRGGFLLALDDGAGSAFTLVRSKR